MIKENSNKNFQYAALISAAVILIAAIVVLLVFFKSSNSDTEGKLNKDTALLTLWEKNVFVIEYDGQTVVASNKDNIFGILRSGQWTYSEKGIDNTEIAATLQIEDGYEIDLYSPSGAAVVYGEERRYYTTPASVTSELCTYLNDNTTISTEDAFTFISVSDSVSVEMLGTTCSASNPSQLASALSYSSWTITDKPEPETDPLIKIDNHNGLIIYLYDSSDIAVISYNGVKTVYEIGELTVPAAALVVKSYLNDVSKDIIQAYNSAENLTVKSNGREYKISFGSSFATVLSVQSWERRFMEPNDLPETCDISVYDDKSFMIKLYRNSYVAEYGNIFFSVPETVFTAIDEYLSMDTQKDETAELRASVSSKLLENKQISVTGNGSSCYIAVKNELVTVLNMSSWAETKKLPAKTDDAIVLTVSSDTSLTVYGSSAILKAGKEERKFQIADTVFASLQKYIQNNLYTEAWLISASELGTLQKSAESAEVAVISAESKEELYSENIDEVVSVLAALNLIPIEAKPEKTTDGRIEILFRGTEKFTMILVKDDADVLYVNVVGTFYSRGKNADRWFKVEGNDYKSVYESLKALNIKSFDVLAGKFIESLRTGDSDSFANLLGDNSFDYKAISTVQLNDISIEKTSTDGVYTVKLNVEDPVDSPFEKGESEYTLCIGVNGKSVTVKIFAPTEKYNVFTKSNDAAVLVDDFTTWTNLAGVTFPSVSEIENKSAIVNYLMILLHKNGVGTQTENGSSVTFTADEIKQAAKDYFDVDNFDAGEVPSFNKETGLYSYTGNSVTVINKRVSNVKISGNEAFVSYEWYSDPLCLYVSESVVYKLKKNESGKYMIISASESGETAEKTEEETTETDKTGEDTTDKTDESTEKTDGDNKDTEKDKPTEEDGNTDGDTSSDGDVTDGETEKEGEEEPFVAPTGLSPTETVFKYYEYINEKNDTKTKSLLVEALSGTRYQFDALTKITVVSCTQISADFEWDESLFKAPKEYMCVAATVNVDCEEISWDSLAKGDNTIEIYLIKEKEDSDWRIAKVTEAGKGLLSQG